MDEVQVDLLKALDQIVDGAELISDRFASDKSLDHQRVVGAIKSLQSQAGVIYNIIFNTNYYSYMNFCSNS